MRQVIKNFFESFFANRRRYEAVSFLLFRGDSQRETQFQKPIIWKLPRLGKLVGFDFSSSFQRTDGLVLSRINRLSLRRLMMRNKARTCWKRCRGCWSDDGDGMRMVVGYSERMDGSCRHQRRDPHHNGMMTSQRNEDRWNDSFYPTSIDPFLPPRMFHPTPHQRWFCHSRISGIFRHLMFVILLASPFQRYQNRQL